MVWRFYISNKNITSDGMKALRNYNNIKKITLDGMEVLHDYAYIYVKKKCLGMSPHPTQIFPIQSNNFLHPT